MKYRSLLTTAAVSLALAGIAGCDREVDDRAGTTTTTPPPVAAPEPAAPPATSAPGAMATPETPRADADRSAGTVVDDATVTAKVKAALMAESEVDGTRINVDTVNGRVVLKGEVPSKTMIDRAVQVARGIEGVRDVDNQLTAGGTG